MNASVVITGLGSFAPERIVRNDELAQLVDTSDAWIVERTGIRERRIADSATPTSELAARAARAAIADAGLAPNDIDLIIVATLTPDTPTPSTACHVQHALGIARCAAFDLHAACSGFLYSLEVAASLLRNGTARRALVIGAEKLSAVMDWTDRSTCVLFGDGAGAAVLTLAEGAGRGWLGGVLCASGAHADLLHIPAGGTRLPPSPETLAGRQHFLRMRGKEVFKLAVRSMGEVCHEVLRRNGLTTADVDLIVPHQANLRIIEAMVDHLGVPRERFVVNLDRYGNTSAASIPLALEEAVRAGRLQRGQVCLVTAFGAGLTWGAGLMRW